MPASGPTPSTTARWRPWFVVVTVAIVALVAVTAWWPKSSNAPTALPSTTTAAPTTPARVPEGRDAPEAARGMAFELAVRPSAVAPGSTVTMRLAGDLAGVSDRLAAVAWLDQLTDGEWRTVYWFARSSATAQVVRQVSVDHAEPGPDAVMLAADAPVEFVVDQLARGSYRMCRYVPLRRGTRPITQLNPVYVCAPLAVEG
jgi:hypothetical protein